MMAQYNFDARAGQEVFNLDQWDGYVAARDRFLKFLQQQQPSNPVVIAGDIHSSWVHDLKTDFNNPNSPTVATEFVGTSISSDFPEAFIPPTVAALSANPHTKFFDGKNRGYVRCHLTQNTWQSDYRVVSTIREPNATISTLASFVVPNGRSGAEQA
jgi:alkaline phosphatase D